MPYINGRLWDTRDRGVEDFAFGRLAQPYAVKDERGEVVLEEYGGKESDGSPIRFAVMCPATPFWQDRVYDITLRLYKEYGVKGVYIDQIAASAARLCFDASHGHPLGGGHWWADGYRQMLDKIRRDMPAGCFLTTECNAEAYVRWFDGYLTWHWQYDGQVPAFPAVYGGALQMFGRHYGGGPTRDLALRMKAGQQLAFGEQIGWISSGVIGEKDNMEFLQAVVGLRRQVQQILCCRRNGPSAQSGGRDSDSQGRLGLGRRQLVGDDGRLADRCLETAPRGAGCDHPGQFQ